jgi:hypothetical protein
MSTYCTHTISCSQTTIKLSICPNPSSPLLVGADACTLHIINSVWGEDGDARLALGGPRGNLSLIRRCLLTLSKVAINTVHIWLTDPSTPILAHTTDSYDRLLSTLRQLLLHSSDKLVFAREPALQGTESINLL